MERWLSWSKAHDWKSCVPYKGTEGSNPSLSAKNMRYPIGYLIFFYVGKRGIRGNRGDSYSFLKKTGFVFCLPEIGLANLPSLYRKWRRVESSSSGLLFPKKREGFEETVIVIKKRKFGILSP